MFALSAAVSVLALAGQALAAPATTKQCDLSKAAFTLPASITAFTAPAPGPSFLGLAVGVQNYTCASTGTYTNVGAVAELVDASCVFSTPMFSTAVDMMYALWDKAPASLTTQNIISMLSGFPTSPAVLGQHYYVTAPSGTGVSPKWDFTSALFKGNPEAFVVASKTAAGNAPNTATDIPWVFLNAIAGQGELASTAYRVQTRGGQPPATCTPGTADITVKYAAQYWLYGSSL